MWTNPILHYPRDSQTALSWFTMIYLHCFRGKAVNTICLSGSVIMQADDTWKLPSKPTLILDAGLHRDLLCLHLLLFRTGLSLPPGPKKAW